MGTSESKEENIVVAQQAPQVVPVAASSSVGAIDVIAVCFVLLIIAISAYFIWRCFKREIDLRVAKNAHKRCTISHV